MLGIVGIVVVAWMMIYLLPDLVFHHLQWGGFLGERSSPMVAITFDDGPGPDTDGILSTLATLDVKATFFVVVERAQQYPDVIQRMVDGGHEVGLHMRRHVSAFLLWPWQSYREIGQAVGQLESLTGKRPALFRPPWGHVNLGTWIAIRRFALTPVFWNIAPDDWREDRQPDWMSHYVVQMAQPGLIVVLHDAGGPRERTRLALPAMVRGLLRLGLKPGRVGDLRHDKSMLHRFWTWWEIRFTRNWDIDTIPSTAGGEALLRIGHIRYRGRTIVFENGTTLRRGEPMGEIHFGNPALSQLSGNGASGLRALHGVMVGFADLAEWISDKPKYGDVKALGGITLLDSARGIERLGFQRIPVRGWTKWSMWLYLVVLMAIYHKDGWKTLRRFRHLKPVLVIMDRDTFITRYTRAKARSRRQ